MKANAPQGRLMSSYYPPGYDEATFNDLAALHATRGAEGIHRRLIAAAREIESQRNG
jgi:hypothetical protein